MQNKLPDSFEFTCPLSIAAAADSKAVPKFAMVAYTGGPMTIEGFPHPVVVDLEGLSIPRQDIPIRLDHNPRQGVGHTRCVTIENGQVTAEGLISRDTSWARDVAKSGGNGFPWQASIGASVVKVEFVPNGQNIQVNGRTFDGPVHIVRQSVLKEISFVDNGADTKTSAKIAAKENQMQTVPQSSTEVTKPEVQKAAEPTKVEAVAPTPPIPATPETINASAAAPVIADPVAQMRQKIAAETKRISAIQETCAGKFPDIEAKAIEDGWDKERTELEVLRTSRPKAPVIHEHAGQATPTVLEASAMITAGITAKRLAAMYDDKTLNAADKMRGMGIQEFCERACGKQLPRFRSDAAGWLQAAFSTLSLPGILSNIANKMLLEGYNYIEDAWRQICKIASVNDFKQHTRYRMTGNLKFEAIGPDGEIKHGSIGEQAFSQKADTHGIMFALTRQMIINDDMGAFTDLPRQIGMGAAEAIAEAVWTLLLSNPGTFFSTNNKNYLAGAETVLSVDGLTLAELLFLDQTKPNKRPLGIAPSILLVPNALKVQAQLLMSSLKLNETTTADKGKPQDNPHAGKYSVVSSSYLGNASFPGSSTKAWYLFADPNRLPAIEVAFLNGIDRPTVEKTDADFNTLGIQFRGYIDFGVKEQDYRGAVKIKGEA